jgi:hypothetical protein
VQAGVADYGALPPAAGRVGSEPHQTGGATNRPRSGSLNDLAATNSLI